MKELYKVLKDHKNNFMQELVSGSFRESLLQEASQLIPDSDTLDDLDDEQVTESVVRVHVVNPSFQVPLAEAISKLEDAKLQIDRIGFNTSTPENPRRRELEDNQREKNQAERLSDNLTVLINDIGLAMKKLEYGLYRGKIFKRTVNATYTYSYRCDVKAFISSLAANDSFKSRLLKDMKKVVDILSDPYCEVIKPITIDYNLIEVQNGSLWDIKERRFTTNAIPKEKIGTISPRAYCNYNACHDPDPKYFREILENSLSEIEIVSFCNDFLQLLNFNKKKHKDKVPCLVGPTNSGKTSLFLPILGVIHHGNVATITKQRVFNKAMINKATEVIFIDEATTSTLDIDDWKILTQGGYAAYDVKYQTAKSFINRCPMLITAQEKLAFDGPDQAAMDRRMRTYEFQSLKNAKKTAATWLKKHPMDCIVWASRKARPAESEEDNAESDQSEPEEGILMENEKEDLRSLDLCDLLQVTKVQETIEEESEETLDSAESNDEEEIEEDPINRTISTLSKTLKECANNSMRYRQVNHLLQVCSRKVATHF